MNNLTQYFPTEWGSIVPPGRSLATSGDVVLFFTCRRCHRHLLGGDQEPPHPRTRAAPSAKPRPAPRASNAAAEHFQCGYSRHSARQRTSQTVEPGSDHYFWHCCMPFCCYTCCPEETPPGELRSEHCCPPTWEGGRYKGVVILRVVILGEQGKIWAGELP